MSCFPRGSHFTRASSIVSRVRRTLRRKPQGPHTTAEFGELLVKLVLGISPRAQSIEGPPPPPPLYGPPPSLTGSEPEIANLGDRDEVEGEDKDERREYRPQSTPMPKRDKFPKIKEIEVRLRAPSQSESCIIQTCYTSCV